jgi:hypothetical protein
MKCKVKGLSSYVFSAAVLRSCKLFRQQYRSYGLYVSRDDASAMNNESPFVSGMTEAMPFLMFTIK